MERGIMMLEKDKLALCLTCGAIETLPFINDVLDGCAVHENVILCGAWEQRNDGGIYHTPCSSRCKLIR